MARQAALAASRIGSSTFSTAGVRDARQVRLVCCQRKPTVSRR